ncbi:DUF3618 domain-containing protein [Sphaerisporangium sp. TRM90804]|uniref:DUF3618 domain-containing protein n=1 Tax=Sphaerisporangium sp. TRM90804 TaxID=3031113 RepID=UPI002449962D|nr:DUF3618 domain-containing protein [Sphaerisporangium sp. TRM90804]MDH2427351.1 DUF3618 domain-containing protein [Sphaerisporangium sp. TRM90804]
MTETDPANTWHRPTAGEVGLHRQEPGTATPESAGPSLNVPEVHAPPKPYVKPVVSHGAGDPLAGLSGPARAAHEAPPAEPGHDRPPAGEGVAERDGHRRGGTEEEALRQDIAHTREELGRTVEALAHKVDVKARARQHAVRTGVVAREKAVRTGAVARERATMLADRLRAAATNTGEPKGPGRTYGGDGAGGPAGVADRLVHEAARRPVWIIAAGAVTMVGAGWVNLMGRRSRRVTGRRGAAAFRR